MDRTDNEAMKGRLAGVLAILLIAATSCAFSQSGTAPSDAEARAQAAALMADGTKLMGQRTPASYQAAILNFQQAFKLWEKVGDQEKEIEALLTEASAQFFQHKKDEALALLSQAAQIAKASGNQRNEAMVLTNAALIYDGIGEEQKALEQTGKLFAILHELGDKADEARIYALQASIYRKLNDTPNALANDEKAVPLFHDTGNRPGEGQALLEMAQLNLMLNQPEGFEKAVTYYTQAIPLFQSPPDRFNEAYSWWGLGTANDRLGRKQQARDAYLKALPFFIEKNDANALGRIYLALGEDEDALGDVDKATAYYGHATPFFTSPRDALSRGLLMMKLGKAQAEAGDYAKAKESYRAAVPLWKGAGNKPGMISAYLALDEACYATQDWAVAMEASSQALKLSQEAGDRSMQAAALLGMAGVYFTHGDYNKSLDLSLQAIELLKGDPVIVRTSASLQLAGESYAALHNNSKALEYLNRSLALDEANPHGRAGTLASMGGVYSAMGDQKKALDLVQQSLDILRTLNDPAGTNKVLNDLGLIYSAMGRKTLALKTFEESLANARTRKDKQQQSATLNNLAQTHQGFGDTKQAQSLYLESLALIQEIGDRYQEAGTLSSLGMVYHSLGEEQTAEEKLNESLAIHRELSDRHGAAIAMNNLALFYSETGNLQKALDYYEQSMNVFRELEDLPEEGTAYNNLASVYRTLGMYDRSTAYYKSALEIREKINDEDGQAVTLNNLAVLSQATGDLESAKTYYEQALRLTKKLENRVYEARLRSGLGMIESDAGDEHAALDSLQRSLAISRNTGDVDSEALALHNLGAVYEKYGELPQALSNLRQALVLWKRIHNIDGEALTLSVIARVERRQDDLTTALATVEESIRLSESLRSQLGSEDLRASFRATSGKPYELKIEILMQLDRMHSGKGYAARGLEASEQGRARSLVELLTEARVNIRQGVDSRLIAQEQSITRSMNAKAAQIRKLTSADDDADRLALNREIEELTVALESVRAQIRISSPAYASLIQPAAITLSGIQHELDAGTLLLEYSLGKERSYVWTVTPDSLHAHELPARERIEEAARALRDSLPELANPGEREKAATNVGAMLLVPVTSELGRKRLVIVSDGLLQALVPFAALKVPSVGATSQSGQTRLLIEDHEIVTEASMSALAALRHETAGRAMQAKAVAVLADPVFEQSDERVVRIAGTPAAGTAATEDPSLLKAALESNTRGDTLARLPMTRDEAEDIVKLAPAGESSIKLDFDASKMNAMSPELADYRVVHFATHGILDQTHPDLSGIVFSLYDREGKDVDGFLRLNEIFNLKLPVQLVVLSACQSGQGRIVGGEGLVGLTRGFLYAGASTMVMSLWKVDDAATGELMKRFYAKMLGKDKLRPAAAMRTAQVEMMGETKWKGPYYWAAFLVEGDWR
jgi:CHAT domain-containing protein/Flp pilus assembly protein TadD